MKLHWLLLVLVVALLTAPLAGQPGRYGGPYGPGYGGVVVGGGFSFSRGNLRVGAGFVTVNPYGPGPFGPPLWRPYPSFTVVSIYSPPPPVIVVQPVPVILQVVLRPRDPDVPPVPAPPRVPEVPRVPEAKKPADPKGEAKKPPPPKRELDLERFLDPPAEAPNVEHARLVQEGRDAFAAGAYGLAAQRFRAATRLRPDEAEPYFLLAQALIALGRYHEASAAVVAGLGKAPDWPASKFRPRDLYKDAGEAAAHDKRLDEALRLHPRDSVLLFLKGHQLWFAGERKEAAEVFRRALPRFGDKAAIERYLAALPAGKP